jgi:hypothetical protein
VQQRALHLLVVLKQSSGKLAGARLPDLDRSSRSPTRDGLTAQHALLMLGTGLLAAALAFLGRKGHRQL